MAHDRMALPSGRRVLVWGGGGHGKVVADVARAAGWAVVGFVDLDPAKVGLVVEPGGAKVLYEEARFYEALGSGERSFDAVALGIGNNRARLAALERLRGRIEMPVLIHPSAVVSPTATVEEGTVIMPKAVLNAAASVGRGVIVNTAAVVEHDCVVEEGVHVSPNATLAGAVRVRRLSWVGAGATVIQCRTVGAESTVGAGSVVIRDVPDGVTVVGCPARVVK